MGFTTSLTASGCPTGDDARILCMRSSDRSQACLSTLRQLVGIDGVPECQGVPSAFFTSSRFCRSEGA